MYIKIRFLTSEDKPPEATLPPSPEQNLSAFLDNSDRWILLPVKQKDNIFQSVQSHLTNKKKSAKKIGQ